MRLAPRARHLACVPLDQADEPLGALDRVGRHRAVGTSQRILRQPRCHPAVACAVQDALGVHSRKDRRLRARLHRQVHYVRVEVDKPVEDRLGEGWVCER